MAPKRTRDPGKPRGPATRQKTESLLTVKLGLQKFCVDSQLKRAIGCAAQQVSRMVFELGKLLNLHFLIACQHPSNCVYSFRRDDFYTIVQGVSVVAGGDVLDLSLSLKPSVRSVTEAQHMYLSLRPPDLAWGLRDRVGNPLKLACQAFWDNCSQDQMMNFERRLTQWWQGQVGV